MGDLKPRIFVHFRVPRNNRPLRVGATHREATKPSEASAERAFVTGVCVRPDGPKWAGRRASSLLEDARRPAHFASAHAD